MSKLRIGIVKHPYNGHLGVKEIDPHASAMEIGIREKLELWECKVVDYKVSFLTPQEEKSYGARYRMALSSNNGADQVASMIKTGLYPIGFLSNCVNLMGMLAGHQRSGSNWKPLKVGLLWFDAHGDFNTPETSLSGMIGGMPVAISTGLCLHHLRQTIGLDPPLPMSYVTMLGVRDVDPMEQYLLDTYNINQITVEEIQKNSPKIDQEIKRLEDLTDIIYVHIDLDVLDPIYMPGHMTPAPNGVTSDELKKTMTTIFSNRKVSGLGLASYPAENDTEKIGLNSIHKIIEGAIKGIKKRKR
jgi:arginase